MGWGRTVNVLVKVVPVRTVPEEQLITQETEVRLHLECVSPQCWPRFLRWRWSLSRPWCSLNPLRRGRSWTGWRRPSSARGFTWRRWPTRCSTTSSNSKSSSHRPDKPVRAERETAASGKRWPRYNYNHKTDLRSGNALQYCVTP